MKIRYKIILFLAIFFSLQAVCRSQTKGFNINKTLADFPNNPNWEIPPLAEDRQLEMMQILNQPFHFLGRGVQCYAFISEDQKTVLKIFKHYHLGPRSTFLRQIRLPKILHKLRKVTLEERQKRMNSIFESIKIAYLELQKETGTLFVHLNTTEGRFPPLKVYDAIGCVHTLNLDQTPFVLQKKAELILPKIENALANNQFEDAKKAIFKLVDLIVIRSQKGISNSDPVIKRNLGYSDHQAVEIDIGSFSKNPNLRAGYAIKREVIFETLELKEWLAMHSPQLEQELQCYIDQLLQGNSYD